MSIDDELEALRRERPRPNDALDDLFSMALVDAIEAVLRPGSDVATIAAEFVATNRKIIRQEIVRDRRNVEIVG